MQTGLVSRSFFILSEGWSLPAEAFYSERRLVLASRSFFILSEGWSLPAEAFLF